MLYFAAIPFAYDIAIAVVGDQDFKPVLQHVRRLGKRVAIGSVRGHCAREFSDIRDPARVKDFDIIWLNDILADIKLKYEKQKVECQSPSHSGDRGFWTEFRPRKGERVYCPECHRKYRQDRANVLASSASVLGQSDLVAAPELGMTVQGRVVRKPVPKPGQAPYGFLRAQDGGEYYFNESNLADGAKLADVKVGDALEFGIERTPADEKAGAARDVRLIRPEQPGSEPAAE
jgi:hypothetical protein